MPAGIHNALGLKDPASCVTHFMPWLRGHLPFKCTKDLNNMPDDFAVFDALDVNVQSEREIDTDGKNGSGGRKTGTNGIVEPLRCSGERCVSASA